jgi:hypothetical protein
MEGIIISFALLLFLFWITKFIAKSVVFPNWAKINHTNPWRIAFFDKHPWLKLVLIRLGQSVLVIFLLFVVAIKFSIKTAAGIIFPKKLNPIK